MSEGILSSSPPSYSPTSPSRASSSRPNSQPAFNASGFPGGYFVIRSIATKKVLDVARGENHDGTELLLWTEKESSFVEVMRDPAKDNQVFFIDYTGNLCCKIAGLPVDIEENRLVLRRHRPVTYPFPNSWSHPLPRFSYDRQSGFIRVAFGCDPAYPSPSAYPSNAWKERDYLLTSVPLRKPKSFLESTTQFLTNSVSLISLNPFGGPAVGSVAAQVGTGDFDLREDEVMEEERAAEDEDDDSPAERREVVMLNLPLGWAEKERNLFAIARRQWEIVPILASRNVTRPRPTSRDGV